jgi:hypothetical protein
MATPEYVGKFLVVLVAPERDWDDPNLPEYMAWDNSGRAWRYYYGPQGWAWYRADYLDHPEASNGNT